MTNPRFKQWTSRLRAAGREARATGSPIDEVIGRRDEEAARRLAHSLERSAQHEDARQQTIAMLHAGMDRRDFLRRSALFGAAATGALTELGAVAPAANAATAPRVVVVGAGFAGLTAAYRIYKLKGWLPAVYEAQTRVGGRARTIRTGSGGQYTEAGPSGISSNEPAIKNLVRELGLGALVDTFLNSTTSNELYFFGGTKILWKSLATPVAAFNKQCAADWAKIGRAIPTYASSNAWAKAKDAQSLAAYIDAATSDRNARSYLKAMFGQEYGGPAELTSSLYGILEEGNFWGAESGYDERYAVPGGNDTLATALAAQLPAGTVRLGQQLTAIRLNTDKSYTLTFASGATRADIVADRIVLAIPLSILRTVDYSRAGFSTVKTLAIQNEPMGTNAKLNIQFNGRPWADQKQSGDSSSDMVTGATWQAAYQAKTPAWLLALNNQNYGAAAAHGLASAAVIAQTNTAIDKLWTGASAKEIAGQFYLDNWPADPWVKGSYAYYGLSGFTTFGGAEAGREGSVHFAGEQTAPYTKRGTMDGAVQSGERCALEITGY
ncbi:NAD(P)/FAD-dependent oxidoreductase [Mycolicibacterium sp.]|uniref:flavin monoamine oxidase family protein n=1 Tax=Mycolicibacterium sp. TaxID=2320850 RepID=UPI001A2ED9D6|nr:NAD(P)/FAD-dependent oxidoreductase [Mycolicibacterium sp.]MBJ7399577.1 FAD-dependent oxidoreductase [Mycolicibacterium sp.]